MNKNFLHTKKFRYGSVSVALTVVIVAAVILLNAIFTALSERFTWYIDMTAEEIYTLSDEAKELLDTVDKEKEVTFIFCTPKDEMEANPSQRYVLYTVLEMMQEYDNVKVKFTDIYTNPSATSHYKVESGQAINAYSVIVTSTVHITNPNTGEVTPKEQFRVYSLNALFSYDSTGDSIIGYNGEQRLVSAVMAVTQVKTPIACYTMGHGETDGLITDGSNGSAILTLLYETGYEVKGIDLTKEDIPADCSLMLIFDPQSDFIEAGNLGGVSELSKLDAFLKKNCAVMTFFDHDTPVLPNLEAFLREWGVSIARKSDAMGNAANYIIKDAKNSFDPDGIINVGAYVEKGLGASITRQLRESNYPKSVVFKYAGAIQCTYEMIQDETNGYYGANYANAVSRDWYPVFQSSTSAQAEAGGVKVDADAPFTYMSVTRETLTDVGGYSYLFACSSTEFASAQALVSSYGNHTVLTRACSVMGGAQVSVSLACKYFTDTEIDSITSTAANQYTVVLTVVPAAIIFIAGIVIMVRRKYA